jgi:hypothetical protein
MQLIAALASELDFPRETLLTNFIGQNIMCASALRVALTQEFWKLSSTTPVKGDIISYLK